MRLGVPQRKLALSLGANVLTRIPSAFGIILFLPLVQRGLGTDRYAALLAALALGGAATFPFAGIGIVTRRIVGEAHAAGDAAGEGDAVRSVAAVALGCAAAMAAIVLGYGVWQALPAALIVAALLPMATAFANVFDNVRAAYNEHYVTAGLQFAIQILLYAIGLTIPAVTQAALLAAIVIQAGGLIASLIGLALLLRARPYLRRGPATRARAVIAQASGVGVADGLVVASIGLAVVIVQAQASANDGAWFATAARLFQTFLAPVLLLLVPLSSYLRLGWAANSAARRHRILTVTFALSIAYGALVSVLLYVAAQAYVLGVLKLAAPSFAVAIAVFTLFGAIVAYKSYTGVAFLLLDLRHLTAGTLLVLAGVAALTGAVALRGGILTVLCAYALAMAAGLVLLIADSLRRFRGSRLSG